MGIKTRSNYKVGICLKSKKDKKCRVCDKYKTCRKEDEVRIKSIIISILFVFCAVGNSFCYPIYNVGDVVIGSPENTPVIVCVGDSLTAGAYQLSPYPMLININPWGGQSVEIVNSGQSGQSNEYFFENSNWAINDYFHYKSPNNLLIVWLGTNGIQAGNTPLEEFLYLRQLCQHERLLGWRVIVMTMISRIDLEDKREEFNEYIRGNWDKFSDGMIDLASTSQLGDYQAHYNNTYFIDGCHLTAAGNDVVAFMVRTYMNNYTKNDISLGYTGNIQGGNYCIGAYPENHSQGFKVSAEGDINKIAVKLLKQSGAVGTFDFYIYSDSGGYPDSPLVSLGSVDVDSLTGVPNWHEFGCSFTPTPNTQYHLVKIWTGGSGECQAGEDAINTNPYSDGYSCYDIGGGWVALSNYDWCFKIYQ